MDIQGPASWPSVSLGNLCRHMCNSVRGVGARPQLYMLHMGGTSMREPFVEHCKDIVTELGMQMPKALLSCVLVYITRRVWVPICMHIHKASRHHRDPGTLRRQCFLEEEFREDTSPIAMFGLRLLIKSLRKRSPGKSKHS